MSNAHPLPLLAASILFASVTAEANEAAKATALEETIVVGRAQQFYLQEDTTTGSKFEIEIMNLPQSVQVLSEQLMVDQAARQITDMYRSIAGVSEFSYSGVTVRGFRESDNVYYDGVRGDPYAGFSVPQLFNIERIDVLLGPSASLYGGGDPGGMINYVTKKPSFEQEVLLTATAGSESLFGGSIDATGAIAENVAGRVGVFHQEQDSFRDNADMENTHVATGLTYEAGEDTSFTLTAEYIDQDMGGHRVRGVPARDNGEFIVDREFNAAEEDDYQTLEAWVGQLNMQHSFDESLSINATLRYLNNTRNQAYHEPNGFVDINGDGAANEADEEIRRQYRVQERTNEEYSLTVDLVKKFATGHWDHTLLLGTDYNDVTADFSNQLGLGSFSGIPNLNIFNPVYGSDPSTYSLLDFGATGTESVTYGAYIQNLIEFNPQWSLMLGLRYDDYSDEEIGGRFSYSDDNISGRAGLVYKPIDNSSIYLNYSESFKPVGLSDQQDPDANGTLDPETGEQWELGWKQMWLDGSVRSTVAIYKVTKEDVPQPNPDDTGPDDGIVGLINLGEVASEGIELTIVGDITDNLTMTANYAYNETTVNEGSTITNSINDGDTFANAPRNQAGLWARYAFPSINSAVAFGVNYVDKQYNLDGQEVDSFSVYDGSWSTSWDDLTMQVNVNNIFDKEYFISGFSERSGNFPGAPREVVVQLRYSL